ncbi:MAG: M20/M25/M40 family metallo-hydrolase [Dehalococcoidia bacterium]|nr:M20/M25/M40 family metallo-hydrolase [Dehalococcoidia bacterium]
MCQPAREAPAARFLGRIIENEGLETEYVEILPNREALFARLPGDGSKRPLMLCNHTDVVPVEPSYWEYPAFEGHIEDGRVYGRGAVDMKGAGIMQLMTLLLLKRNNVPLRRDIVFCAVPDEEAGSAWGMEWLCKHRPDLVDVDFEISEGGGGSDSFLGEPTKLFTVATNEKAVAWLRLTAVGTPGHGSRPHQDNSAVRLMEALLRLHNWERPMEWTPDATAYIRNLCDAGLLPPFDDREAVEARHPPLPASSMRCSSTH